MEQHTPLLELEDLCVDFDSVSGKVHAVRGVTLTLKPGEILALVGESGCGKTVLCRSIAGLLPSHGKIASGTLRFRGQKMTGGSKSDWPKMRKENLGILWQNPMTFFHPSIPVGKQITEGLLLLKNCSKKEATRRAAQLLTRLEVPDVENRLKCYPHQWSGGMLQRGALAAALLKNPALLLADEPTTALDTVSQEKLLFLLKQCSRENGLSVLFVTHDLLAAGKVADRIAVMYGGKIIEIGTTKEIMEDPKHPYTWGLMTSLPAFWENGSPRGIPGAPPDLRSIPQGDMFAPRNPYAMKIDYQAEAPMFSVTQTHCAATWLLHPFAPSVDCPDQLKQWLKKRGKSDES